MPMKSPEQPSQNRQIRVFISSTFRDMQRERELLVKRVFPELRRICTQRFVTFTEVDLRWGITEEQAAEGKVLPLCLAEIERSRPYFIGLLGERYGWIPDAMPQAVIDSEVWLKEHIGQRTSVTELEILHGVLNNPKMADHTFFYFRDPTYLNSVPENERGNFVTEDEKSREKLQDLKDRIRRSGLPVLENYANPEILGEAVRKQFITLIDDLYPEAAVPDALTQEARGHEAYARGKLLAYVERPSHTAALDEFVSAASTGNGLVVTGDSGSGKTALLADWVRHWRASHSGEYVFEHYFGATPESASVDGFLRRLLGELKRLANILDEIPSTPEKLREVVPLWLAQAGNRGRIVLVLDALNQTTGDEPDRRLTWLPRFFPPHVRVIASSLAGTSLDVLEERGWAQHHLPLADESKRDRMIEAFFDHYRKTLEPAMRRRIATASGSANPLFLRTVLEELRQFGSFEQLPSEAARYLEAKTPEALFQLVLGRWQQDFHAGSDLVRRTMRYLWAARQGLSETELLEVLGTHNEPLPRQFLTPLFLTMEPHLLQHAGLFVFGHDYLRRAVEEEFVPSEEDRRSAHIALADYFEQQPIGMRIAIELPWQLRRGNSRERLRNHLLVLPLFLHIMEYDQTELMSYWVWLGEERTVGKLYLDAFERWSLDLGETAEVAIMANRVSIFLLNAASYTDVDPLMRRALAIDEKLYGLSHPKILYSLQNLAWLLANTNRLDQAESMFVRAIEIGKDLDAKGDGIQSTILTNYAKTLHALARYEEAVFFSKLALEIDIPVYGEGHWRVAMHLLGLCMSLRELDNCEKAESVGKNALSILEGIYGLDHPEVAIASTELAETLRRMGQLERAEPLIRRALQIDRKIFGNEHPRVAIDLNDLATLLLDYDEQRGESKRSGEAESMLKEALNIDEETFGDSHPYVARDVGNIGALYFFLGRTTDAIQMLDRALRIDESCDGKSHPTVALRLNNYGMGLGKVGRLDKAKELLTRALAIYEATFGTNHSKCAETLSNLALVLNKMKQSQEAEQALRRALQIYKDLFGYAHKYTIATLSILAGWLTEANRLSDLLPELRPLLSIDDNAVASVGVLLAPSLTLLAGELQASRQISEAEKAFRMVIGIMENANKQDSIGFATALDNLGQCLYQSGRLDEAAKLVRRELEVLLRIRTYQQNDIEHINNVLLKYVALLERLGADEESIRKFIDELSRQFGITLS